MNGSGRDEERGVTGHLNEEGDEEYDVLENELEMYDHQ
jgi:hypothetical protein